MTDSSAGPLSQGKKMPFNNARASQRYSKSNCFALWGLLAFCPDFFGAGAVVRCQRALGDGALVVTGRRPPLWSLVAANPALRIRIIWLALPKPQVCAIRRRCRVTGQTRALPEQCSNLQCVFEAQKKPRTPRCWMRFWIVFFSPRVKTPRWRAGRTRLS